MTPAAARPSAKAPYTRSRPLGRNRCSKPGVTRSGTTPRSTHAATALNAAASVTAFAGVGSFRWRRPSVYRHDHIRLDAACTSALVPVCFHVGRSWCKASTGQSQWLTALIGAAPLPASVRPRQNNAAAERPPASKPPIRADGHREYPQGLDIFRFLL